MSFNEPHFIKLIFTLSDTQIWLNEIVKETLGQLPLPVKKKFLRKDYYLSVTALAHILERHYYKIPRHPHAGKFHLPVIEILHFIREAYPMPVSPVNGSVTFQRSLQTNQEIGFNRDGLPTCHLTVLTDSGGNIITAFPGQFQPLHQHPGCPSVQKPTPSISSAFNPDNSCQSV